MNYLMNLCLTALLISMAVGVQGQCNKNNIKVPPNLEPYNKKNQPRTLTLETKGIKELKLLIYTTKGTKVFESSSALVGASEEKIKLLDTGWDGMQLGENLAAGIYIYSMEAQCLDKSMIQKSGSIILTIDATKPMDQP